MAASGEAGYFVRIDETLVGHKAGTSADAKARELRAEGPIGALTSRILRRRTDERAWAKGAFGERVVGWMLDRLPEGWYVFHDVPVGNRGTNIDHVLVGPAGVFTVNTKNLSGTVRVTPRSIRVNGVPKDFLPRSVHEAGGAVRLLSAALGRPIEVRPILAIAADELDIAGQPADVHVGGPRGVKRWVLGLPETVGRRDVLAIAAAAAKPSTWRDARAAGGACVCGGTLVERTRRKDGRRFLGCSRYPACRRTYSLTPDR